MAIGQPYRFKLSNLPLHPEGTCYPTIEIIDRTYPPPGLELKFPIPVVFNDDDIRRAMDGMLVTRVIYVEDPQQAIPGVQRPGEQLWHDVGPTANPLQEADRLGRPVAIVRLGGRVPDERQGPDYQFVFGSPQWHYFANTPDASPIESTTKPTSNVEVIGEAPAKPIVGQPLPTLARECYEGGGAAPPLPHLALGTFVPPGIKGPWPPDEYLHDGGDALEPVGVSPEWRVQGLNVEDTVAHYDTLDGRTLVERTNCEYVYSPRFSSVRTRPLGRRERVHQRTEQLCEADSCRSIRRASLRANQRRTTAADRPGRRPSPGRLSSRPARRRAVVQLAPIECQLTLRPYENLSVIRTGAMQSADKARLAESVDAAIAWTKDEGVLVFVDKLKAVEHIGDQRAQAIYTVKEPTYGRLRICKIASTPAALPGEFVEFTLALRQCRRPSVGQYRDPRQPHDALGVRRRNGVVEPQSTLQRAAERSRVAANSVGKSTTRSNPATAASCDSVAECGSSARRNDRAVSYQLRVYTRSCFVLYSFDSCRSQSRPLPCSHSCRILGSPTAWPISTARASARCSIWRPK